MPRSAPIDGFSLAYDRVGSGPPVVLLHGWPGTRRDFRALVPLLTDGAQVVTPDLRDFGEPGRRSSSPRPTSTGSSRSTPSRERSAHRSRGTPRSPMKVVHCECGTDVEAESDDELVAKVEEHVQEHHPEMVGQMTREQILGMAHDH